MSIHAIPRTCGKHTPHTHTHTDTHTHTLRLKRTNIQMCKNVSPLSVSNFTASFLLIFPRMPTSSLTLKAAHFSIARFKRALVGDSARSSQRIYPISKSSSDASIFQSLPNGAGGSSSVQSSSHSLLLRKRETRSSSPYANKKNVNNVFHWRGPQEQFQVVVQLYSVFSI